MSEHKDTGYTGAASDDRIPVLYDVVFPEDEDTLPSLSSTEAVYIDAPLLLRDAPATAPDFSGLSDTLCASLEQQLGGAIDHAVHEQLQAAMDELAANIKTQVRAQLEVLLPDIVEAAVHQEDTQEKNR